MMTALDRQPRSDALAEMPHWRFDSGRNALYRKIIFHDFREAMAFIVRIGLEAEKADHHPEWSNVYNRVEIWLTTHDAGGVSTRDIDLAHLIDGLAEPRRTGVREEHTGL